MAKAKEAAEKGLGNNQPTKTDMVREAMAEGIEKPAEINQYVLKKYGVELGKYVNVIKSNLKKQQGQAGGRNRATRSAFLRTVASTPAAGSLSREDLEHLAEMVRRVGVPRLREVLDVAELFS